MVMTQAEMNKRSREKQGKVTAELFITAEEKAELDRFAAELGLSRSKAVVFLLDHFKRTQAAPPVQQQEQLPPLPTKGTNAEKGYAIALDAYRAVDSTLAPELKIKRARENMVLRIQQLYSGWKNKPKIHLVGTPFFEAQQLYKASYNQLNRFSKKK